MLITNTELYISLTCYTGILFYFQRVFIEKQVKKQIKENISVIKDNILMLKDAVDYVNNSGYIKELVSKNDNNQDYDDAA